jgi:hypothetical protein
VERTFEPDASIVKLLRERRPTFRRLYGALKTVREGHDS